MLLGNEEIQSLNTTGSTLESEVVFFGERMLIEAKENESI